MMTCVLVFFFCLFFPQTGQCTNIDSLRTVANELPADSNGVKSLIKIASTLRNAGEVAAEEFGQQAVAMAIRIGDLKLKGDALSTLGTINHLKSNYDQALSIFLEADKAFREANHEVGVAKAHINIGAIYLTRNNNQLAKNHLLEAKEIVDRLDVKKYKVSINTNLAIIYTKEQKFSEAMQLHESSLEILGETNSIRQLAIAYSNIGYLYEMQDSLSLAYTFYKKAYQSAVEGEALYYEGGYALQNIVNVLGRLKRFEEADHYVSLLMPIVEKAGSPGLRAEAYRSISSLRKDKGDYKAALENFEAFFELQDSLVNIDQNEKMAEMQKEYDIYKRDAKIAKIEKEAVVLKLEKRLGEEQAAQRFFYMVLMGIILILLFAACLVLFIVFSSRSKTLRELQASHNLIDTQKAEIELQNQALKVQNDRLEDLNREKDGLVGIVAHDLKSPLNKALALAELLGLQGELNANQQRSVGMMQKVARSGNDLIRDLLDLNAVEHPDNQLRIEEIELSELFSELSLGFDGEAERKKIKTDWKISAGVNSIKSDHNALVRVLDNLVSNAMKFSDSGTTITIEATAEEKGGVLISIADQGPGISEKDQKKLFKKFQRLTAQPTGGENSTGLGLAITKALVEKLGGSISVKSELGAGTTFLVRLP